VIVLPYGRQYIDDEDVAAVTAVLRGDWLTQGPHVERFEQALAAATGAPHVIACANGTAALHLAAMALKLGPGDAVIVPAVTFLATANAARYVGADVVFADVDADSGLMTESSLREAHARAVKAGRKPRSVFVVHLAGQVAHIARAARELNLSIVEDACHALGATQVDAHGREHGVGSCTESDIAIFSFHPVKTIATGEGGACSTRDPKLAEAMRRLRTHGMTKDPALIQDRAAAFDAKGELNPWYYEMPELGFNFRITDLQSALGASQMAKLPKFIARRTELVSQYDAQFAPLAPKVKPLARSGGGKPAWHLYVVLIDFAAIGRARGEFMASLRKRGVGSQVHYVPLYRQPYYRKLYGAMELPGAEAYYRRALSLPMYYGLADADVKRVVEAVAAEAG
jgi:UDP-4-amino-4,6-dideoxy-N-acetyl-beta-L-altrosamine transaminase